MNKTKDCLTTDSYVCGLNSELFLHRKKPYFFQCILTLYLIYFYIDLELPRSLTNGNHFSSTYIY